VNKKVKDNKVVKKDKKEDKKVVNKEKVNKVDKKVKVKVENKVEKNHDNFIKKYIY
jgi:hypothetical protein